MTARRLIVLAAALLLAVQVVRNAAVGMLSTLQPATAAKFWAGHPSTEISLGLAQIGTATHARRVIGPATFALIDDAAAMSPLSAEPFLVRGVQAQTSGDMEAARRAFVAAQWRDPRSLPAAYFLADYYLRTGHVLAGLEQTTLLARLSPNGIVAAPFVATFAQDRANWAQMRALFRSQPSLEDEVLAVLSQDGRNADAVLALADAGHRKPDSPWLAPLLASLVSNGDYARARAIWSSVGDARAGSELVYDASFSAPGPPPPFNWALTTSTVGLAERQPGQRLHVIFYGSEDGVLARQLLLLPAGKYRLQMHLGAAPAHAETLGWSLRCDKATEPVASIAIGQAATHGWTFEVPRNCPAQWLELSGRSGDVAQQAEATITGLSLTRAQG